VEGIRVNAVGPGPIFTPFDACRVAASGEPVQQDNARAAHGTMLKRPGRAEEPPVSVRAADAQIARSPPAH